MATYYVNLDLGKGSSGHAGTQLDPFSVTDYNNAGPDNIFYFSGWHFESTSNFGVRNGVTILPWHPNQPWRLVVSNNYVFEAQNFSLISGGIIELDKAYYPIGPGLITNCFFHLNSSTDWWSFESILRGCYVYRSGDFTPHGVAFQSELTDCVIATVNCPLATNRNPTWTNCAFDHAQGFGDGVPTFVNCITNWVPGPNLPPIWNASETYFDVSTMIGALPTPPQPGNPPYTGYETFLWGSTRTGIGTGYTVIPVTSPDWILTYPKTSIVRYSKASFLVEINMNGTAYFVVLPSGSTAPSSAQVKAGTNSLDQPVSIGYSGSVVLLENVEGSLSAIDLMSGDYDVYFVAESESLQDVPVMLSIQVPKVEPINPEKPGHTFYNVVLAGNSEVDSSLPKVTSMFRNIILPNKRN